MSKEISPLEALENIKQLFVGSPVDISRQMNLIEKALNDYENLKREYDFSVEHYKELERDYENLKSEIQSGAIQVSWSHTYQNEKDKKLKALKIIQDKKIDIDLFYECPNIDEYNYWCANHAKLAPEEYNLLKEVLL